MLKIVYNIFMSEKNTKKTNIKTQTKTAQKKPAAKKAPVKKVAPKVNKEDILKKENEKLKEKIFNLELHVAQSKTELEKANQTFLDKVKTLQDEAQQQISKFREEHKENMSKEIKHIKKYAGSKFFTEFIEPLLNLELAINAGKNQNDQGVQNYVVGFEMLLKQIEGIMENSNVTKLLPKVGDKFNPETMFAVQVTENKEKADKVISIKKPGYKMHDRVIKPASVEIGK